MTDLEKKIAKLIISSYRITENDINSIYSIYGDIEMVLDILEAMNELNISISDGVKLLIEVDARKNEKE